MASLARLSRLLHRLQLDGGLVVGDADAAGLLYRSCLELTTQILEEEAGRVLVQPTTDRVDYTFNLPGLQTVYLEQPCAVDAIAEVLLDGVDITLDIEVIDNDKQLYYPTGVFTFGGTLKVTSSPGWDCTDWEDALADDPWPVPSRIEEAVMAQARAFIDLIKDPISSFGESYVANGVQFFRSIPRDAWIPQFRQLVGSLRQV